MLHWVVKRAPDEIQLRRFGPSGQSRHYRQSQIINRTMRVGAPEPCHARFGSSKGANLTSAGAGRDLVATHLRYSIADLSRAVLAEGKKIDSALFESSTCSFQASGKLRAGFVAFILDDPPLADVFSCPGENTGE